VELWARKRTIYICTNKIIHTSHSNHLEHVSKQTHIIFRCILGRWCQCATPDLMTSCKVITFSTWTQLHEVRYIIDSICKQCHMKCTPYAYTKVENTLLHTLLCFLVHPEKLGALKYCLRLRNYHSFWITGLWTRH